MGQRNKNVGCIKVALFSLPKCWAHNMNPIGNPVLLGLPLTVVDGDSILVANDDEMSVGHPAPSQCSNCFKRPFHGMEPTQK